MNIQLLMLAILVYFSQIALAQPEEKIRVTGFARLLEEDVFLPNAAMYLDVFDWDGNTANLPDKISSTLIKTDDSGRFDTKVEKGRWFRLSLEPGKPPNINEAMAVWMQHALPGLEWYSEETVKLFLFLNSKNAELLHYIATDSGLMQADRDYVGRNREISFQVPLVITANILKKLAWSIYGENQEASNCQLVVTALSPRKNETICDKANPWESVKEAFYDTCPTNHYQPEVQNLFDCPHGASGVTFSSVPESKMVHYFGINDKCKTDVLVSGLTETTRDGGAFLVNLTPSEKGGVGLVRGKQKGTELPEDYFLCEPGKIINISPPHGPAGLKAEVGYKPSGSGIGISALVGILVFAADILLSPFSTSDNSASEKKGR